jgi:DNA-binding Lrp family transcriptional regulator
VPLWKGGVISWGLKHRKILVRVYTYTILAWLAFIVLVSLTASTLEPTSRLSTMLLVVLLFWMPTLIPLYLLKRRERGKPPSMPDPYLASALEKLKAIERYLKGEVSVTWSPVVTLAHDALLTYMQRMLVELKGPDGVKTVEQMRREKKLFLEALARQLAEMDAICEEELKSIEILRDLRNRVVHEDYHPTRAQALWAYNFVKNFIEQRQKAATS